MRRATGLVDSLGDFDDAVAAELAKLKQWHISITRMSRRSSIWSGQHVRLGTRHAAGGDAGLPACAGHHGSESDEGGKRQSLRALTIHRVVTRFAACANVR